MLTTILGLKQATVLGFDTDGTRLPLTGVKVGAYTINAIQTQAKNGYCALQLAWGTKKLAHSVDGTKEGAKKTAPLYLKEISVSQDEIANYKTGDQINPTEVLKPGDLVKVTGITKGKGFQGVVRRWHFKGGPRTHGQSDRERAPGSIGMTTTPGRVFQGKHMAGHMGHSQVTVQHLTIMDINAEGQLILKGLVPGPKNGLLFITKTGENKKFVPLQKEATKEVVDAQA